MFDGRDELSSREAAILVFSVAVGYIKHLAMTRVAWELPCFQPLQTRGSDAGCRQPSPPCGRVGQVCRVCVPCVCVCAVCAVFAVCAVCAACACVPSVPTRFRVTIYGERLALLLAPEVHPFPEPAHHTCSPSSTAGTGNQRAECCPRCASFGRPPQSTAPLISPGQEERLH